MGSRVLRAATLVQIVFSCNAKLILASSLNQPERPRTWSRSDPGFLPSIQVAAGAALGNGLQGFNTGVIAGALLQIIPEFDLAHQPAITGFIASSTTLGAVLGTILSAKLSDSAGRQRTLFLSSGLFILAGLLMLWAPTAVVLIGGRFIGGIAAGISSTTVPMYIAECAEPKWRGALSTLPQVHPALLHRATCPATFYYCHLFQRPIHI